MDVGYEKLKEENPKKRAGLIKKLLFGWMVTLIRKSTKKNLEVSDLYKVLEGDDSKLLGDRLEKNWKSEVLKSKQWKRKPSLLKAILRTFLCEYMLYGILWFILNVVFRCLQPVILGRLIALFAKEQNETNDREIYIYSALLIGLSTCAVFINHHVQLGLAVTGMRIRIACCSLVYRKVIKLNNKSLAVGVGQIVNLLSNDVHRFDLVTLPLHTLWTIPVQVGILWYFIWLQVGISSLVGLVSMMVVSLPLQGYVGKFMGKLRAKISQKTDKRVKLMNEVITGIRVIKMYSWEKPFERLVDVARKIEIGMITVASYLRGVIFSCLVFLEKMALSITIICYVSLGNTITAEKVFSIAQAYNILQLGLAVMYPMAMAHGAEALVSVKRLREFLILDEKAYSTIEPISQPQIILTKVSASWSDDVNTLSDITIQIPPGYLCAIVGPVGAGKSSLLQLLLGELPVQSGQVQLGGSISYSSQESWLFNSTVRNNIIFGKPFDQLWYDKVVKVCALRRDFDTLAQGDLTLVGERGVSLSGGQRARINLARAIYRDADVYLLDDPLSAVDTHVGKHLFEQCIVKHLKGKTRILVTHQLQYLKKANLIIVLNEGKIEAVGTFKEISKSKTNFTKYLVDVDESASEKRDGGPMKVVPTDLKVSPLPFIPEHTETAATLQVTSKTKINFTKFVPNTSSLSSNQKHDKQNQPQPEPFAQNPKETTSSTSSLIHSGKSDKDENSLEKLQSEEQSTNDDRSTARIAPLKDYILAAKRFEIIALLLLLVLLSQVICVGVDLWVTFWTSQEALRHENNSSVMLNEALTTSTAPAPIEYKVRVFEVFRKHSMNKYVYSYRGTVPPITTTTQPPPTDNIFDSVTINGQMHNLIKTNFAMYFYGLLIILLIVLTVSRSLLFFKFCMMSSINMHQQMFSSLLNSPMKFFDANPSGKILNRFSKDIGAIDEILPKVLMDSAQIFLTLCGVLVNVVFSNPYSAVFILILGVVFNKLRGWYIFTAKVLKRLEGTTKSPMLSHVNSSLSGIATIRASNAESVLTDEFDEHQNVHTSAWYLTLTSSSAFGLWLDLNCVTFLAAVTLSFIFLHKFTSVDGSMVGLAISQAMVLTGMVQFGMRQTAEAVNQLTAVERVLQYTKLETEQSLNKLGNQKELIPRDQWPRKGEIEFRNVFLKYSSSEPAVLQNINFTILPGEKVGIVGRTGAGKSSLITVIFRLAQFLGNVFIDHLDTKAIDLSTLRRKISIIPQEPILFSATLRYNLDPFDEFTDEQIWNALDQVELKECMDSLDVMVSEAGSNFSVGQRQLICLARAVLRNNKILILDEATANVDHKTDALIQSTIRERFKDCTTITIAHRLNTIMDCDKIMVMNYGKLVEYDHPHKLLQADDGHFHNMVLETGPVMSTQLKETAMMAYYDNYSECYYIK